MGQVLSCNDYVIPFDAVVKAVRSVNPRRVLIHAPNGFKHLYTCLEERLRSFSIEEVYFSSSPGYGACDIPVEEAEVLKTNLVIHLGHDEYFLQESTGIPGMRIVYVPVYYQRALSTDLLESLYNTLKSLSAERVALSSTLVESLLKKQVSEYLARKGIVLYDTDKPILGCLYSHVVALESKADAHVVIAGGLFHAVGLGLVASRPVIAVDPYMNRLLMASNEAHKVLRKRLYAVLKARESTGNRVGLVVGTRPGQYRPTLSSYIERLALDKGYRVYKVASSYLTLDRLIAMDSALNLDFYVVTSCPRLPIDDLADFHKPVLTPGEFIMLLTGSDKYLYPW
ncbi:MAG: diphthamide biosynthesis enzyme Dph2 [Desulfurococcaceae archaeon]